MSVEELLKLEIAFNHILEDRVDTNDFTILDKYEFIKYYLLNGVQIILYPNKKDVKRILKDLKSKMEEK